MPEPETTATAPIEPQAAEPKTKRRRAPLVIGIVVAVLVLLVVGYILLDNWARQQVSDIVTDQVHQALDSDQPVDVDVAGFSVIAQAITGSLDRVDVAVDDVTVGQLAGDVKLTATNIPIDLTKPVEKVDIEFVADESSVQTLVDLAAGDTIGDVSLVDGEIRLHNEFSIFGLTLTLSVGVVPSAEDGMVAFAPSSIDVNGATLTADELEDRFGSVVGSLLQTRTVCIADRLPAPLALSDLQVEGETIVLSLEATDVVLDQATLSQLGSC